uniref:uncharacterized protein LOC122590964 n=1 Tax=Erigeron canadensis TaxID=72917 RepID=UPI001CB8CAD5|nr:uncharacterized protein LOC122590964 [Erigeron canadensis]
MKQILYQDKHDQEWVQKVSESSLKMLDSCGTIKDILCLVKGHIQELQSTFRRASLGESERKLTAYCFQRKEMRKQMLKRLNSLKKVNTCTGGLDETPIDDNLMVVGNVMKQVRKTVVILLESIMLLMSMPNPSLKTTKKVINCNGAFAAKVKFTRVNSLSQWEDCDDVQTIQSAIERLEAVESAMEDLEVELGCIFKRLMRTRVLLLNILTN